MAEDEDGTLNTNRDWKTWKMKMAMESHGTCKIVLKSLNFVISHAILPILPLNCMTFVFFFVTTKKVCICVECPIFRCFPQNAANVKIEKRDGHGKLKNDHGKVMKKYFVKSVGTLFRPDLIYQTVPNIMALDP